MRTLHTSRTLPGRFSATPEFAALVAAQAEAARARKAAFRCNAFRVAEEHALEVLAIEGEAFAAVLAKHGR